MSKRIKCERINLECAIYKHLNASRFFSKWYHKLSENKLRNLTHSNELCVLSEELEYLWMRGEFLANYKWFWSVHCILNVTNSFLCLEILFSYPDSELYKTSDAYLFPVTPDLSSFCTNFDVSMVLCAHKKDHKSVLLIFHVCSTVVQIWLYFSSRMYITNKFSRLTKIRNMCNKYIICAPFVCIRFPFDTCCTSASGFCLAKTWSLQFERFCPSITRACGALSLCVSSRSHKIGCLVMPFHTNNLADSLISSSKRLKSKKFHRATSYNLLDF